MTLIINVITLYPHTDIVAGIRLGLKQPGTNTLAYLSVVSVTKKGFITLTLSINVKTLYFQTDKVTSVRLGLKQPGRNTLAYLSFASVMKKKVS
jgi:hypothetical protein